MFRKKFKVTGEDVDDFMVMENTAYHHYASSILNSFLFEKGYSKQKIELQNVELKASKESFSLQKHLMFTQEFFVNLELSGLDGSEQKLNIKNRFFNANNELCATMTAKLHWTHDTWSRVMTVS